MQCQKSERISQKRGCQKTSELVQTRKEYLFLRVLIARPPIRILNDGSGASQDKTAQPKKSAETTNVACWALFCFCGGIFAPAAIKPKNLEPPPSQLLVRDSAQFLAFWPGRATFRGGGGLENKKRLPKPLPTNQTRKRRKHFRDSSAPLKTAPPSLSQPWGKRFVIPAAKKVPLPCYVYTLSSPPLKFHSLSQKFRMQIDGVQHKSPLPLSPFYSLSLAPPQSPFKGEKGRRRRTLYNALILIQGG